MDNAILTLAKRTTPAFQVSTNATMDSPVMYQVSSAVKLEQKKTIVAISHGRVAKASRTFLTNKCRSPGEAGDVCHPTRPCADDLVCPPVSQVCRAPGADGESCSVTEACDGGLTCDLTSNKCRGKSSVGGRCHLSRFCKDNLHCDLDDQTCKTAAGVGSECNRYVPCVDGLECDDGTCIDLPVSESPAESKLLFV